MNWAGAKVAAMQIAEDSAGADIWAGVVARQQLCGLWPFEEKQARARAVVRLDASDHHTTAVWNRDSHFHRKRSEPLRINAKVRATQVGGGHAAVDGTVIPVGCHTSIVVTMKVGKEVTTATFDFAKTESIDGEGHAFQRFVKRGGPGFRSGSRSATVVGGFDSICCGPLFGF